MNKKNLRYEKKWICNNLTYEKIYYNLSKSNFFFQKHHRNRVVNSVYYDDKNFSSILNNIEGEFRRRKYRIRWYGNSNFQKTFYFEKKNKIGFVSFKEKKKIVLSRRIDVTKLDNFDKIKNNFNLNAKILDKIKPVIFIKYERTYLVSSDKLIRATIDRNISYNKFFSLSFSIPRKIDSYIIELKYKTVLDNYFRNKINNFPFRYTKSSKYVMCMLYNKNLYFN